MDYLIYNFQNEVNFSPKKFGIFLKYLREKNNVTQKELAEILKKHEMTISTMERGKGGIRTDSAISLINFFNAKGERLTFNSLLIADIKTYEDSARDTKEYGDDSYKYLVMRTELRHAKEKVDMLERIVHSMTKQNEPR